MSGYLVPAISLYLDRLVDWPALLTLRNGTDVDPEAEVGAYRTVIERVAEVAASFEERARGSWSDEAELIDGGGAVPPAHIRDAYDVLKENGLLCMMISEA